MEEGGTALTLVYIGLIIHTDSPLTHHPCLQTLQVWQKILKTHIFSNHRLVCILLFMYLWSDYYSPPPQLLHATVVNNNQIKCIGQNFKLLNSQFQTNWEKKFWNCVWCWKWRLCGNVFLPYSNDRLTLPFTQIWFDMLKLGPCPNPATASPQTPTNFTIFQIKAFGLRLFWILVHWIVYFVL